MKQTSHLARVTLVCGTIIVLAPIIQNMVALGMMTHLLAIDPKGEFHLNGMLSHSYEGWCIFLGIGLFIVGVVLAFRVNGERNDLAGNEMPSRIPQTGNA